MTACYSCRESNPQRIVTTSGDAFSARFPARFEGPPGNVNGGMGAGALACPALLTSALDGSQYAAAKRVTARLRRGVPAEHPLDVNVTRGEGGYGVSFALDDDELMTGAVEIATFDRAPTPRDALGEPAPEHAATLAEMSRVTVPAGPPFYEQTGDHPIPNCFSCGPANADGMQIIPRVVADGVIASAWQPDASFDDGGGMLSANIIASALDCSSGICMPVADQRELLANDEFFLLGSLDVRYVRVAPLAASYRVIGRALRRDGRKFFGLSALFDDGGVLYATAEAIWIVAGIKRTDAFG
ncbi:MAG TPA: hypothetical protein VIH21_04510 [Dehalococcoidia bacterium]